VRAAVNASSRLAIADILPASTISSNCFPKHQSVVRAGAFHFSKATSNSFASSFASSEQSKPPLQKLSSFSVFSQRNIHTLLCRRGMSIEGRNVSCELGAAVQSAAQ
jgi:hypothetical protein